MNAARDEIVDRSPDPGVIECHGGDTLIGRREPLQCGGERIRIEHIDMHDIDIAVLPGQPVGRAFDLCGQIGHEAVGIRRQDEGETVTLVAGEPHGGGIGPITELGDGGFDADDGLPAHALALVDDTVRSGQRHAGFAGDVFQRRPAARHPLAIRTHRAAHSMPRVIRVLISGTSSS